MPEQSGVILQRASRGESSADELLPPIYESLHRLAQRCMRSERSGHTLQATALVHEAYLQLAGVRQGHWKDRAHYFAAAAAVMRRILVQHARTRHSLKRGRGWRRVPLDFVEAEGAAADERVLQVDEALRRLAALDPDMAHVVELRFFAGLSTREIATAMGTSERTIARRWEFARAWLLRSLREASGDDG